MQAMLRPLQVGVLLINLSVSLSAGHIGARTNKSTMLTCAACQDSCLAFKYI